MSARRREKDDVEQEEKKEEEEEERSDGDEDFEEAVMKAAFSSSAVASEAAPSRADVPLLLLPEPAEDYLRNFLRRSGLSRTLRCFQAEWSRLPQRGLRSGSGLPFVPDALTHRRVLVGELEAVCGETERVVRELREAGEGLRRMRRERDSRRLLCAAATRETEALHRDVQQLRSRLRDYQEAVGRLEENQRRVLKMIHDLHRSHSSTHRTERTREDRMEERSHSASFSHTSHCLKDSQFPSYSYRWEAPQGAQQRDKSSFSRASSTRGHTLPISSIDLHPAGALLMASASEDRTWRLWGPSTTGERVGELLVTGKGHTDWLSGCSFHPDGSKLATTSGDMTVRLWDFSRGVCLLTLSGHTQPCWGVSFHSSGLFLASCSADRTARLWDLSSLRCRLSLRRHSASVNSLSFLPSSSLLLTCSADRSLLLWDARLGVTTASFQAHQQPCYHAAFSPAPHILASCDCGGVVNLWDTRKPQVPLTSINTGPLAANHVAFSPSGRVLAVAGSDCLIRLVEWESGTVKPLEGHSGAVQCVKFDQQGEALMSAGSDGMINVWC